MHARNPFDISILIPQFDLTCIDKRYSSRPKANRHLPSGTLQLKPMMRKGSAMRCPQFKDHRRLFLGEFGMQVFRRSLRRTRVVRRKAVRQTDPASAVLLLQERIGAKWGQQASRESN